MPSKFMALVSIQWHHSMEWVACIEFNVLEMEIFIATADFSVKSYYIFI